MTPTTTEAQHLGARHVRDMFARISGRYDFLNHLLSVNRDKAWRRKAVVSCAVREGEAVVDLCSGTGDLALEFAKGVGQVAGFDFCRPMLQRARDKAPAGRWCVADSLKVPLADGSTDVVSVAFGIRNVVDLDGALAEMFRLLKPGGRACILEFTSPPGPIFGRLWRLYFHGILPRVAGLFSEKSAYSYLPKSVAKFPDGPGLNTRMEAAGFTDCSLTYLNMGIVGLHLGYRR